MPTANEIMAKILTKVAKRVNNVSKGDLARLINQNFTSCRFRKSFTFCVAFTYLAISAY